jgi:Zn-dependent protease
LDLLLNEREAEKAMGSSLKIASVFGIEVRIHLSFLLVLAFFWIQSGTFQAVLFVLILFVCVLLHEFGHAFAARAFGIKTRDITLNRGKNSLSPSPDRWSTS